jgi:hypothetical protein
MVTAAASILGVRALAAVDDHHHLTRCRQWWAATGQPQQINMVSTISRGSLTYLLVPFDHHCFLYAGLPPSSICCGGVGGGGEESTARASPCSGGGADPEGGRPGSLRWPWSRSALTFTSKGQRPKLLVKSTLTRCKHTQPTPRTPSASTRGWGRRRSSSLKKGGTLICMRRH